MKRQAKEKVEGRRAKVRNLFSLLVPFALLLFPLPGYTSTRREEPAIELVAVGDILLDRGVARRIEREGASTVFARVRDTLSRADLAFGNLECPLAEECNRVPQRISFKAQPRTVATLTGAGFDVLSLANNHSLDCGRAGLLETMLHLRQSGLRWCGAGRTRAEAEAPVVLNVKGIRVAFVGFTSVVPPSAVASKDDEPNVAVASRAALQGAVAAARLEADVVVVSLHWGIEYASRPGSEQRELARVAVEAGADLVLGHHTHTLEGVELLTTRTRLGTRRALVIYSLGNFAFDSTRVVGKRVSESVILRCELGRNGLISAEILPVILENYLPRPATAEEAQSIRARMTALSAELGTRITKGSINLKE
jgi:poly-gamma-glutamate capsule biosynthesis protein CapA/YwtB (metallophosphatase superfamily)